MGRPVAIVATAQSEHKRAENRLNEVEMLMPVLQEVREKAGVDRTQIDFTCSGSSDYLAGQPLSFVMTLDGVGAYPPIVESHVEMDGAWALYEAWVKLQMGSADVAMVYSYGKSSPGDLPEVLSLQLDPYYYAPLWPDSVSVAALQAQAMLQAGKVTKEQMAEIAVRDRANAKANPKATIKGDFDVDKLLAADPLVDPLHKHDCAPISDGAVAVIMAAGDRARELSDRPAWITGIDHRIETHMLGIRDLTSSPSTAAAAEKAGVHGGAIDVAELHAPFTHQAVLLSEALGLNGSTSVNPSGGALSANPMMAAGLIRIAEVADRISAGDAGRGVAHATGGPCLQQNLVAVLEGDA